MMLESIFKQHSVPLWGIASLEDQIEGSAGYRCIVFGLPYDSLAIAALPDNDLINRCREDLSERTRSVYRAIAKEFCECRFLFYDEVDKELGLRKKGISQKVLAHLAGLGWIGKSSLLISDRFGPRIRIGAIFTKDALEPIGYPFAGECGNCTICSEVCPVDAISKNGYDVVKCMHFVTDERGEYKTFCGLCMKACPIGNANKAMHTDAAKPRR